MRHDEHRCARRTRVQMIAAVLIRKDAAGSCRARRAARHAEAVSRVLAPSPGPAEHAGLPVHTVHALPEHAFAVVIQRDAEYTGIGRGIGNPRHTGTFGVGDAVDLAARCRAFYTGAAEALALDSRTGIAARIDVRA